jgi:hypothetical protein
MINSDCPASGALHPVRTKKRSDMSVHFSQPCMPPLN